MILTWLIIESVLPVHQVVGPALSRGIDLIMALLLVISLICLGLISKKSREKEHAVHSREITEMQREVERTARRYKSLMEGAGNAIFVFDAENGVLEDVNRRGTELLGYSREEMGALRGRDFVPEEEQERGGGVAELMLE